MNAPTIRYRLITSQSQGGFDEFAEIDDRSAWSRAARIAHGARILMLARVIGLNQLQTIELPDYLWPDPNNPGSYVDAWNGSYDDLAEALQDSAGGEGQPWVLTKGEGLITQEEAERRVEALDGSMTEFVLTVSCYIKVVGGRVQRVLLSPYNTELEPVDGTETQANRQAASNLIDNIDLLNNPELNVIVWEA